MRADRIGFIGFGEVASVFSEALRAGGAEVAAFDVLLEEPGGREALESRARDGGIRFLPLAEVVAGSDLVLSTVTTSVAVAVAESALPHLSPGAVYVDLNATAPAVKTRIAALVEPTGAAFVEGAILGAVGVTGARTRVLTGGGRGAEVAEALSARGLHFVHYSEEIGRASAFKMVRSVFSKGMEALLLEFLAAGRRAGIQADVWEEVVELFSGGAFERVAENWVRTHPGAVERRYHEMVQVSAVLREMGIDPVVTEGVERFFDRSRRIGWSEAFPGKPDSLDDVVAHLEPRLGVLNPPPPQEP